MLPSLSSIYKNVIGCTERGVHQAEKGQQKSSLTHTHSLTQIFVIERNISFMNASTYVNMPGLCAQHFSFVYASWGSIFCRNRRRFFFPRYLIQNELSQNIFPPSSWFACYIFFSLFFLVYDTLKFFQIAPGLYILQTYVIQYCSIYEEKVSVSALSPLARLSLHPFSYS